MDCSQIRRLALDGASLAAPEVRAHLDDCDACRELVAGGGELARLLGENVPSADGNAMPDFADLEREIAGSRGWRSRLAELPTRVRWALVAAALAVPLIVGFARHRHNLGEYPPLRLSAELLALAAVAVTCSGLWIRPLFKRQPGGWISRILLAVALTLPLLLSCLPAALPTAVAPATSLDALRRAANCLLFGSLIAMPALVLLLAVGRRWTGPRDFALLPATAAALAGIFGLELHCPDASPSHLLMGHASVSWLLVLLLVALQSRLKPTHV